MGLTEGLSNHLARSLLSLNVFECGTEEEKKMLLKITTIKCTNKTTMLDVVKIRVSKIKEMK